MRLSFWFVYIVVTVAADILLDNYFVEVPLSASAFFRQYTNEDGTGELFPAVLGPIAVEISLFYLVQFLSRTFR